MERLDHKVGTATLCDEVFLFLCFQSLEFPYEFQDQLFDFCKETRWHFNRDCIESIDLASFNLSELVH